MHPSKPISVNRVGSAGQDRSLTDSLPSVTGRSGSDSRDRDGCLTVIECNRQLGGQVGVAEVLIQQGLTRL